MSELSHCVWLLHDQREGEREGGREGRVAAGK